MRIRTARAAQQSRQRGAYVAREVQIPLPLRGFHNDAAESQMDPRFAGRLDDWLPRTAHLQLRPTDTVVSGNSTTLQALPYEFLGIGQPVLITPDEFRVGSARLAHRFTDLATAAYISSTIVIAGGGAEPIRWNGTEWSVGGFTTDTGKATAEFDGITAHADRPFFWDSKGEPDFYYGDVGAVTGALTRFPLSRLGNITGTILAMHAMTVDAGDGMNDVLCIFMTTGQIVIYEGLNPGDATQWQQTARVKTAPPLGKHAFMKVGGDLWMVTASGIVSVAETLRAGAVSQVSAFSVPVAREIAETAELGGQWQAHMSGDGRLGIFNRVSGDTAQQFVWDFEQRAWTRTNYPARWWYSIGRSTFFISFTGSQRTLSSADADFSVTAVWHSTWMPIGRSGAITAIGPQILSRGPVKVALRVLTDFNAAPVDLAESFQEATLQPDNPAGTVMLDDWIPVDAAGGVFQVQMEVTARWAKLIGCKALVL